MNSEFGKALFDSYDEAISVCTSMLKKHKRRFNVYKIGSQWAIGGVHTKRVQKVKTLGDMRMLYHDLMDDHNNSLIDNYVNQIEVNSHTTETVICGESDAWILESFTFKKGHDLNFKNDSTYLCLLVVRGEDRLELKMGGKFSSYFPVLIKQCEKLRDKNVIWYTWNSKDKETDWSANEWFYRIEENKTKE